MKIRIVIHQIINLKYFYIIIVSVIHLNLILKK